MVLSSLFCGGPLLKMEGMASDFNMHFIFKPRDSVITVCSLKESGVK